MLPLHHRAWQRSDIKTSSQTVKALRISDCGLRIPRKCRFFNHSIIRRQSAIGNPANPGNPQSAIRNPQLNHAPEYRLILKNVDVPGRRGALRTDEGGFVLQDEHGAPSSSEDERSASGMASGFLPRIQYCGIKPCQKSGSLMDRLLDPYRCGG